MKKLIASTMLVLVGIGIGTAVGTVAAGAAIEKTLKISQLDTNDPASEMYMAGYVAGTYDTIQAVKVTPFPAERTIAFISRSAVCMTGKGSTVGEMLAWAKYRWMIDSHTYPDEIAASSLIADACKVGSE
jgi:hypothetical protein